MSDPSYADAVDRITMAKQSIDMLPRGGEPVSAVAMQFAALGHLEAARLCLEAASTQR